MKGSLTRQVDLNPLELFGTVCRTPDLTEAGLRLGLRSLEPRLAFPGIEVSMYWQPRFHREPGHVWLRELLHGQFFERAL